jgi:hypothetical protein
MFYAGVLIGLVYADTESFNNYAHSLCIQPHREHPKTVVINIIRFDFEVGSSLEKVAGNTV